MSIAHLFNETATLIRQVESVPDGQGGWTSGGEQTVGQVQGRIRAWTSNEELIARQAGVNISHIFYCAANEDIRRGDVLEVRGITHDVRSVRRPSVSEHHQMVDLEERQT